MNEYLKTDRFNFFAPNQEKLPHESISDTNDDFFFLNSIKLMFPCDAKKKLNIERIVNGISGGNSNWRLSKIFQGNTRLLSHISDSFFTNQNENNKAKQVIFNKNCFYDIDKEYITTMFKTIFPKKLMVKIDFVGFDFWIFETGIFFFSLNFEISENYKKNITQEKFFWIREDIKKLSHTNKFREFIINIISKSPFNQYFNKKIKSVLEPSRCFEFFENHISSNGNITTRPLLFSSFLLSPENNNLVTDIDNIRIPYWYAGFSDVKSQTIENIKGSAEFEEFSVIPSIKTLTSNMGCCICGLIDKYDKDLNTYLNRSFSNYYQHALLEYMLLLHQVYYLTKLKKYLMSHNNNHRAEIVRTNYVNYLSKNLINFISVENKYQLLYEYMQKKLKIKEISKEIELNITPITDRALVKRQNWQNALILILSIISLIGCKDEISDVLKFIIMKLTELVN